MSMAKHALLSASGAHRWLECTPSALLELQFPQSTSEYAEEGTAAHELCELTARYFLGEVSEMDFENRRDELAKGPYYNAEMQECANDYARFVAEKTKAAQESCEDAFTELEVRVDFSKYVKDGFGTGDCIIVADKVLEIVDFKYGKDCFKDLGVEKYVIVETLDNETCSLCAGLDGKVYPMSEYQVGVTAPPFHPWCRGTTAPYYKDMQGLGDRFARDVKTGESFDIPKDMTYKDWKARQDAAYGTGTVEKFKNMRYNESADKKQYENYKARLGADAPKSFAAFQQLKYNSEGYKDLTGYYRYKGANPTSDKRFWTAHKVVKALHDEGKVRTTGTLVAPPLGRVAVKANEHAEKRFASRGITLEWTQNIIDNADFALKQRKGTQYAFYTSKGFAVLDNNGEIGTAGQLDERGKLLYDEVMKHVRAK